MVGKLAGQENLPKIPILKNCTLGFLDHHEMVAVMDNF